MLAPGRRSSSLDLTPYAKAGIDLSFVKERLISKASIVTGQENRTTISNLSRTASPCTHNILHRVASARRSPITFERA